MNEPDHDAHAEYLASLAPMAPEATIHSAICIWQALREIAGTEFATPGAFLGDDGEITLGWDDGPHHLTAEVFEDGRVVWSYHHRVRGERVDCESRSDDAVPLAIARILVNWA